MINILRNRYQQSLEKKAGALDPQTRADLASEVHASTLVAVGELQVINASIEKAQLAFIHLQEKKNFIGLRLVSYQEKLARRRKYLNSRISEREIENQENCNIEDSVQEKLRLTGESSRGEHEIQNQGSHNIEEEAQSRIGLFHYGVRVSSKFVDQGGQNGAESDSDASNPNEEELELENLTLEQLREHKMKLERDIEALERVERIQLGLETESNELQMKIFVLERRRDEILQKTGECRDFLVAAAHIEQVAHEDDDTVHSHEDLEEGQFGGEENSSLSDGELIILVSDEGDEHNNATQLSSI